MCHQESLATHSTKAPGTPDPAHCFSPKWVFPYSLAGSLYQNKDPYMNVYTYIYSGLDLGPLYLLKLRNLVKGKMICHRPSLTGG